MVARFVSLLSHKLYHTHMHTHKHLYLFKCDPHREEGYHLEDVELQKPPEKHLNLGENVREPSGQNQQPVHHQAPLTGYQLH